jgi:hypothetical protein
VYDTPAAHSGALAPPGQMAGLQIDEDPSGVREAGCARSVPEGLSSDRNRGIHSGVVGVTERALPAMSRSMRACKGLSSGHNHGIHSGVEGGRAASMLSAPFSPARSAFRLTLPVPGGEAVYRGVGQHGLPVRH